MVMTYVLLILAVLALIVLAASSVATLGTLLEDRRRLDILTERLSAEHRIEQMTRATLHAMRDTVRQSDFP
jgi:uncharacterized membrane protein (DUF4010 family)